MEHAAAPTLEMLMVLIRVGIVARHTWPRNDLDETNARQLGEHLVHRRPCQFGHFSPRTFTDRLSGKVVTCPIYEGG